jgi:octaprenyl-diphosphate synthase
MTPPNLPSGAVRAQSVPRVFAGAFGLLEPHLAALDRLLQAQLEAFEPEIRGMAEACIDTSGKRIRPALVFFSSWNSTASVSPETVRAAAVVELIHLATLVHDDIMDGADVRRGHATATRAFGSASAVLLGDALFAHALNLATQFPTNEVCAAVSESTRRVCAGEIVQTLRRGSFEVTRSDYRRIIELKTAELFRVSCFLGARLAGSEPAYVDAVSRFGEHLGIAYQIYDDLVDFFGKEDRIGKTLGTDLLSGKLTLPLFALMERLPPSEKEALKGEIEGREPARLSLRLRQMNELGVFSAVEEAVGAELASARAVLSPAFDLRPPTPLLLSLAELLKSQVSALRR